MPSGVYELVDPSPRGSEEPLYKTELIHRRGPWNNADDVEWATLIYIDRFNNRRIHSSLGDLSPAEFEAAFYDETKSANRSILEPASL